MFSVALQVTGSPDSDETPRLDGPRHCGQLSAGKDWLASNVVSAIRATARRAWWFIWPVYRAGARGAQ
jgi:hypothetical protein